MKIFSAALNMHDHNTYDGTYHRQEERLSRKKHNLLHTNPHSSFLSRKFFHENFLPFYKKRSNNNIIAFTCSNLGKNYVLDLLKENLNDISFLNFKPKHLWDYVYKDNCYYIDHHQSHASYAFLTSNFKESDILAIDGKGSNFSCIFVNKEGLIIDLTHNLSIGGLWNLISNLIGLGYLGAGKIMGLASYGKYNEDIHKLIDEYLKVYDHKIPEDKRHLLEIIKKEDIAFTLQYVTEQLIEKFVYPLKTSDNICLAGGVAYNGYINEKLTKHYKNVHVPPAVGDEGQSLGSYMHANYTLNKTIHIPNVFSGKKYYVKKILLNNLKYEKKSFKKISKEVAHEIANGKIIGWYQDKSESGNRALGNRSILADPRNPKIKDIINLTIKLREDFRPFAPSVLEEHYKEYFDTNSPSPYMSRIVPVISDKIPGVTHVDNTARIQTVNKNFNKKFYSVINDFYKITGIPMLLNTSFNCKEPIVETPQEAIDTFLKTSLDILVINNYIIKKND